jgi:hypothetical protein
LDARIPDNIVKVKFTFGSIEKKDARYFITRELESHLEACQIIGDEYRNRDRFSFVTIEDFGTTGLDGSITKKVDPLESRSNYYNFWWREGISKKKGKEAGRWGLGKTTFHMASKLKIFWGITVRYDDNQKLLMGKAFLKTHELDGNTYKHYGYFSTDGFDPIKEANLLDKFNKFWAIDRNNESGLSLIIPEPDEQIKFNTVLLSSIIHYFYAILNGILIIEIVDDNKNKIILDANTIIEEAKKINWDGTSWGGMDVVGLINFIRESINIKNEHLFEISIKNDNNPEISGDSFGDQINNFKNLFNAGKLVSLKIPIKLKPSKNNAQSSFYKIFIQKSPSLKKAVEFYVRSGITIAGIKECGSSPVKGLLVVDDEPVASFLGMAETPAHIDWNERTERFKEEYDNAIPLLRFIKKSMYKLVSTLDQPPEEMLKDFLKDIFSIPIRLDDDLCETDKQTIKPVIPHIVSRPSKFNIIKIEKGFEVRLSQENNQLPFIAEIKIAYDIQGGNPFKNYHPFDFDFSEDLISIVYDGCDINKRNENVINVKILNSRFILKANGFDSKRDLIINIREIINEA